jgi:hypothetical protein
VNPADERMRELLDKWLTSLELHLKYVSLDEASYRRAQPWPEHDRPSRWIIEVARGKARELRDQLEARIKMGDAKFSESLELMTFLVNLVGARVDRFIPLAESTAGDQGVGATGTRPVIKPVEAVTPAAHPPAQPPAPVAPPIQTAPPPKSPPPPPAAAPRPVPVAPAPQPAAPHIVRVVAVAPKRSAPVIDETTVVKATDSGEQRALKASIEATREMPRPAVKPPDPDDTVEAERAKPDTRKVARREAKSRSEPRAHSERAGGAKDTSAKDMAAIVVADAVRLIVWGRQWHELVELIGRFAERPSATEIRRILRENRASIEKTADKERSKKKKR